MGNILDNGNFKLPEVDSHLVLHCASNRLMTLQSYSFLGPLHCAASFEALRLRPEPLECAASF